MNDGLVTIEETVVPQEQLTPLIVAIQDEITDTKLELEVLQLDLAEMQKKIKTTKTKLARYEKLLADELAVS